MSGLLTYLSPSHWRAKLQNLEKTPDERYQSATQQLTAQDVPPEYAPVEQLEYGKCITVENRWRFELVAQYWVELAEIAKTMLLNEHRVSCLPLSYFGQQRTMLLQSAERWGKPEDLSVGEDSYTLQTDFKPTNKGLHSKVMELVKKAHTELTLEKLIAEIGECGNLEQDPTLLVKRIEKITARVRGTPLNSFPHVIHDEALEDLMLIVMKWLPAFEAQLQCLHVTTKKMHQIFSKQLDTEKEDVAGVRNTDTRAQELQTTLESLATTTRDLMKALQERRPYLFDGYTPVTSSMTASLSEQLGNEGATHLILHYFLRIEEFHRPHSKFVFIKSAEPPEVEGSRGTSRNPQA